VLVVFVPVALVHVRFANDVGEEPVIVRLVTAKFPVDVPPANWIAFVVIFPPFVIVCNVPVEVPNWIQVVERLS
jgi:hypothetical protein